MIVHRVLGAPAQEAAGRGAMDARMRTYTSADFQRPLDVAGHPILHLRLSTDRREGALFVYLEDAGGVSQAPSVSALHLPR